MKIKIHSILITFAILISFIEAKAQCGYYQFPADTTICGNTATFTYQNAISFRRYDYFGDFGTNALNVTFYQGVGYTGYTFTVTNTHVGDFDTIIAYRIDPVDCNSWIGFMHVHFVQNTTALNIINQAPPCNDVAMLLVTYGGALNPASVTITNAPNHGTTTIDAGGNIHYTPAAGFTGTDTLVYSVCDQLLISNCDTAYQIIRVLPQDAANTTAASDDYANTLANTLVNGNVKANDIDPEGNNLNVTPATTNNAAGTFTINDQGDYTFTPAANFVGSASYSYQVCDNGTPSACATATVYILVYPANTTPLPVKVIDFGGKALNDHSNLLTWKVTDVKDMDSYEIIRSADQKVWTSLGRIAAENKDGIQSMQLIDNNPDAEDFYKLVLHGQNGQSETYPKVVHIRRGKGAGEWVKLYPNPAETVVNLEYYSLEGDIELNVELMDVTGRKIKSVKQQLSEGSNIISVDISGIADGVYNIHYTNTANGRQENMKFIKKTQ